MCYVQKEKKLQEKEKFMKQALKEAKKAYDKMMNREQPDNTKPAQPTDTKKDSQSTNKVETTNQKTTSVKTGDETNVVIFVSLSMVSGGLFLVLRKEYERVH